MKFAMELTMLIEQCVASGRVVYGWTEKYDCMWACLKRMLELESDNDFFYYVTITDKYGVEHFEDALM